MNIMLMKLKVMRHTFNRTVKQSLIYSKSYSALGREVYDVFTPKNEQFIKEMVK